MSLISVRKKKLKDNRLSTFWFGLWVLQGVNFNITAWKSDQIDFSGLLGVLGCTFKKRRLKSYSLPKLQKMWDPKSSKYFLSKTIVRTSMNLSNLGKNGIKNESVF